MSPSFSAPAPAFAQTYSEATIADIGRTLRRKWRWIAYPTLAALIASTLFVFLVSPRYTGEAKLLLQAGDASFTRPGSNADRAMDQQPQIDDQAVASQVQVVLSRDIARDAIRSLGLVGNEEFDPQAGGKGVVRTLKAMLGLPGEDEAVAEDRVLEKYYDNLLVYPVGKSRIVAVEFRSKDAGLAARGANTIAELYLGVQEDAKRNQARSASTWLGSNIDGLRRRVADAEAKVEAFRTKTGLLAGAGTSTLSAQQLTDLSSQLGQARAQRSDAQAKARLIRDTLRDGRAFDIPDVANNELIRRLLEQRVTLKAQLALELRTLLPQHPRIKELNAQLGDLEQQIRVSAERTVRTLENDAKIAGSRVEALEAAIDQQKKIVAEANAQEVELRALEREARIQREQLETYLGRYRDAAARDTDYGVPPDARIVSRAVVPQIPSFPKKGPIIALSTLAMFLLAAGALISRELLSTRGPVREEAGAFAQSPGPHDVAFDFSHVAASHLSRPPLIEAKADEVAGGAGEADPNHDFAALVERVSRTPIAGRGRRLLVAGLGDRDEVIRVALGLGGTLARASRTVVLEIDTDEDTPVDATPGVTDLVAGEATFSEVIAREPSSRLHRIAPGTLTNEALTASPESFETMLEALDSTYGWVVCTLVGAAHDDLARLIAPRVDAVVLASNLDPASSELLAAYDALRAAGGKDVIVASGHAGEIAEAA